MFNNPHNYSPTHSFGLVAVSELKTHIEALQRIDYDYEPPCPESQEAITINSVTLHGIELLPALSRSAIDALEELCLEDVSNKHEKLNQ